MKTANSILALALASVSTALPTNDKPISSTCSADGLQSVSYLAKFDNVASGTIADLPARALGPLGVYDNLSYNLNNIDIGIQLAGVQAQSSPNAVSFDVVSNALQGGPFITSKYPDSITDHFKFKSFYFGCVVTNVATVASVPSTCSVTANGFRNGQQVATQTFKFQPPKALLGLPALSTNMTHAVLASQFGNVDKVTFAADGFTSSTLEAVLLDNFAYDVYLKKGGSFSY